MIKLTQETPIGGDYTAGYVVTLDNGYTVEEFVNEILTKKEWGYITISNEGQMWFDHEIPRCEYREDKLIIEMSKEVLPMKIKSVMVSGGWSRMDYFIQL